VDKVYRGGVESDDNYNQYLTAWAIKDNYGHLATVEEDNVP
jgi:hypothetical protein